MRIQLDLNVPYSRRFQPARSLDLFLPPARKSNGRAILFIHGGGWRGGSKEQWHSTAIHFCQLGYTCASAEYRLAPACRFPGQIEDVRLAMAFFRSRARRHGFAANRIAALGSSSGGHLVAMLATIQPGDPLGCTKELTHADTRPNAAVCYCPVTVLHKDSKGHSVIPPCSRDFIGRTEKQAPELYRSASPLARVTGKEPPFLFIHGDADRTVPLLHSTDMAAALKQHRVPARVVTLPGVEHGFGYGVLSDSQKRSIKHVTRFLNATL